MSQIDEIKARISRLTDYYDKHQPQVKHVTIFPADFRYLTANMAEAYLHGFDKRPEGIYFRDHALVVMRE